MKKRLPSNIRISISKSFIPGTMSKREEEKRGKEAGLQNRECVFLSRIVWLVFGSFCPGEDEYLPYLRLAIEYAILDHNSIFSSVLQHVAFLTDNGYDSCEFYMCKGREWII